MGPDSIERRKFLECTGLVGALAVAGCTGGDPDDPADDDSVDDDSADDDSGETDRSGGIFRQTVGREARDLNPLLHVNIPEYHITGWCYQNLCRMDHELQVHPDLATDWEPLEDGREWIFELREGSQFHYNDEQVTAHDVKATLETIYDPDTGSPSEGLLGPISHVDVDDDLTARIVLDEPYSDLPLKMGKEGARIVPAEVIEDDEMFEELSSTDYGSGPFNLQEFVLGERVEVVRNPDYWAEDEEGNELPYLDGAVQEVIPEISTEMSTLERGDSDQLREPTPEVWDGLGEMDGVERMNKPSAGHVGLALRTTEEPFDDNQVRLAMKHAVNYEEFLESMLRGLGQRANHHPVTPPYRFYDEDQEYIEHDPDRAMELLDEAGYPDGFEFTCYVAPSPDAREDMAVIMQSQFEEVGINMEIELTSYDFYIDNIWLQAPAYIVFYAMRPVEDGILMLSYHSDAPWNDGNFSDEEFDEHLETAMRSIDEEEQAQHYAECQRILAERGPMILPVTYDTLTAIRDWVNDFDLHPTGVLTYNDETWLSDEAPTK